ETECTHINNELNTKSEKLRVLELEYQNLSEEVSRLQSSLDDSKSKASIMQKRIEEREQRLRKLETEN
ncbi:unnamed protein product, partial [Hymenolepis diminuta]